MPSTSDDLDELATAELADQLPEVDGYLGVVSATPSPQRAGAHQAFEPSLFPAQRHRRHAFAPRLLQFAGYLAQRGQTGTKLRIGWGAHRGDRQGSGPPAFTPGEQQPRLVCLRGMALGQRGQFGAMCGGLGPQFRRAQGEPMLVQNRKPAAAGGQQAARIGRGLGPQRFAEPAGRPRHRRAAPPAPCGGDQMTVCVIAPAQVQCHPPGQQVRLRCLAGAELGQSGGRPLRRTEQLG